MRLSSTLLWTLAASCSIRLENRNLTGSTLPAALLLETAQCSSPEEIYLNNNQLDFIPEITTYAHVDSSLCMGKPFFVQQQFSLSSCQELCSNQSLCMYVLLDQGECFLFQSENCRLAQASNNSASLFRKDIQIAGMQNFTNLLVLDLSHNLLTSIPPGISRLSSLIRLELEDNLLVDAVALAIPNHLPSLKILNLNFNQFSLISGLMFSSFPSLTALHLNNNPLISLAENGFSGLRHLLELRMSYNRLTSLPNQIFSSVPEMQILQLSHNNLTSVPAALFQNSSNLSSLTLTHTALRSLPHDIFHNVNQLKTLKMQNNSFSALPSDLFDDITSLAILEMDSPPACKQDETCEGQVRVGAETRYFLTASSQRKVVAVLTDEDPAPAAMSFSLTEPPTIQISFVQVQASNSPSVGFIVSPQHKDGSVLTAVATPTTFSFSPTEPPTLQIAVVQRVELVQTSTSPSLGVIVGTVLGSLCALKIILFIAYVYGKRKLRERKQKTESTPSHGRTSSLTNHGTFGPSTGDAPCGPYHGKDMSGKFYDKSGQVTLYRSDPKSPTSKVDLIPTTGFRFYNSIEGPALPIFANGSVTYTATQLLGKGNFGVAYLAADPHKNLFVVKTISRKDQNEAVQEAKTLCLNTPQSPHLLKIVDFFFEHPQMFCLVLNYCRGGNLQELVGNASPDEVERILKEIATGLACLHASGMIHRDLKPDNIFLRDNETKTVVIGDMGMARLLNPDGYFDSSFGHILYKAPEIEAEKRFSTRSDMWAVGCIGFELLSGQSLLDRFKNSDLVLNKATPEELAMLLDTLPESCKHHASFEIVRGLLVHDAAARLTADQVKSFASSECASTAASSVAISVLEDALTPDRPTSDIPPPSFYSSTDRPPPSFYSSTEIV